MSGLFSKKYHNEQQIQEGQVPDDISDQPVQNHQHHAVDIKDDKKNVHEQQQFIFQTVPIHQFEDDYVQKDKSNYGARDYYQSNNYTQKKDWDRNDRENRQKNVQKSQKSQSKKQYRNIQPKQKFQADEARQPPMSTLPPGVGGYPYMQPPLGNPYAVPPVNPYYPPGYNIPPANLPPRPSPYGVYHPSMHQHPNAGMYIPPPQNPYQISNPHLYPIPPPISLTYGQNPMVQPPSMNDIYNRPQRVQMKIPKQPNVSSYQYEQGPQSSYTNQNKQSNYKQSSRQQSQNRRQKHQYRQKASQDRYDNRERSRDRKDYYDQDQPQRNQRKDRYDDNKNYQKSSRSYQNSKDKYRQSSQSQKDKYRQSQNYQNQNKKSSKQQKILSALEEQKSKTKVQINQYAKILFGNNNQEMEQFLFILRDVLKFKLLKKEQDQLMIQQMRGQPINLHKKKPFYVLNGQLISTNYQKALLKLEKLIISHNQAEKGLQNGQSKRQALFKILQILQLQELVNKINQLRIRKKLVSSKKMSQIKKLLEEYVKDPRKRVK